MGCFVGYYFSILFSNLFNHTHFSQQYYMDIEIEKQIGMKVERVLGRGSFATVYYCVDNENSHPYAVKIFHKQDLTKKKLQCFRKQAQILSSIVHKNIVLFKGFQQTESCLYLIMQYIAGGTLKQLMNAKHEKGEKYNEEEIALMMRSILEGIKYLHKFNIIHRDLKPDNILVADPADLTSIKIVDFGLSAQIQAGSPTNVKTQCGTLLYMAPEILHQPSYSKAVDIWSCAIIMYMFFSGGKHPIYRDGMSTEQFKQKLKLSSFPKIPNALADNFMRNLSKLQYTERYSVNEALKHPWITRNEEDQIPLSVNESIQSFNTSNVISNAFKFIFTLANIYPHETTVPEQYKNKLKHFEQNHESARVRSPSYKKTRRRTNEVIVKLKQLLVHKQKQFFEEDQKPMEYLQLDSPIIRRHQKLFMRLFERNKQETSETIVLSECLKPVQNDNDLSQIDEKVKQNQQTIDLQSKQMENSIAVSFTSYNSYSKNKSAFVHCDLDLPLIKINPDKKPKGTLRKMNSLREEGSNKHEQNMNNLKSLASKNSQVDFGDLINKKSKRSSGRNQQVLKQQMSRNTFKKQPTIQRGKTLSKSKQVRPMIFGIKATQY